MRHFSSSYLLPTFELATFKPLLTSHRTSLIWKLTSTLKALTKKPILHLWTSSMTAEDILVAQGVNHPPFLDKMLPSQHHHPVITGKEQHIWLLAPGKGCKWSHWMISKYVCINDIPKITIQVFHGNISRNNLPGWLQKCVFLHRVSNIFQGDVQHL